MELKTKPLLFIKMTNQFGDYIHGYSDIEQECLITQAEYWKNDLILKDIKYKAGEKLLEIGCGAGAVLGILGTEFTGLELAGIDLEEKQINYASQYLSKLIVCIQKIGDRGLNKFLLHKII